MSTTHDTATAVLLPAEPAFELLGLGRTKGWELIRSGELPTVRVGRRRLIHRRDLEAFAARLAGHETAPDGAVVAVPREALAVIVRAVADGTPLTEAERLLVGTLVDVLDGPTS